MQNSSTSNLVDSKYISRDDETEQQRLQDLNGVGEPIFLSDEEVKQYSMADFGLVAADTKWLDEQP